jgi:hypothetical protein
MRSKAFGAPVNDLVLALADGFTPIGSEPINIQPAGPQGPSLFPGLEARKEATVRREGIGEVHLDVVDAGTMEVLLDKDGDSFLAVFCRRPTVQARAVFHHGGDGGICNIRSAE